jgi:catechol 2,3-dioxygenase-like lactoylglutathione lyase family enzyme
MELNSEWLRFSHCTVRPSAFRPSGEAMITHFDHVTVVVRDLDAAKRFFALLGFEHDRSVVISGEVFSDYMGVPDIEADHVTLVLAGAVPRAEVQLLAYRTPAPELNPTIEQLNTVGFNHVCFAVDDLERELDRLRAAGIETRTKVLSFRGNKLVFLRGPEGITVELSERDESGLVGSGTPPN